MRTLGLLLFAVVAQGACSQGQIGRVNHPPSTAITSHDPEDQVYAGYPVTFVGSVSDLDDPLDSLSISWRLGDEEVCSDAALDSKGRTTCTLTIEDSGSTALVLEARDPDAQVSWDTVELEILPPPPPGVQLVSPGPETLAHDAMELPFEVLVDHPVEAPSELVVWLSSDRDGLLTDLLPPEEDPQTGEAHLAGSIGPLSRGEHVLTATARSSLGVEGEVELPLTIYSALSELVMVSGDGTSGTVGEDLGQSLVVEARDPDGDPVEDVAVNWSTDGGSLSTTMTPTDEDGQASVALTLGTTPGPYTVTAEAQASDDTQLAVDFEVTAELGDATQVLYVEGDDQQGVVDQPLGDMLAVEARDGWNNLIPGAAIAWEASGDGQVSEQVTDSDDNGQAMVVAHLGSTAQAYTFTATLDGTDSKVTFEALAQPEPVSESSVVEIVSGNDQEGTVDEPLDDPLKVRVLDSLNNPIPGAELAWESAPAGASVSDDTTQSDGEGLTEVTASLGTAAGSHIFTATLAGTSVSVDFQAEGLPDDAVDLVIISGHPQSGVVNTWLEAPLVVETRDTHGNPVPGTFTEWGLAPDQDPHGATVTDPDSLVAADENGRAQVNAKLGTQAGPYDYVASIPDEPAQVTFVGTAEPDDDPAQIVLERISGQDQEGHVYQWLDQDLSVEAQDAHGNKLDDVDVVWLPSGDARVSDQETQTNAQGRAQVEARLGNLSGPYTFTAELADNDQVAVVFDATAEGGSFLHIEPQTFDMGCTDGQNPDSCFDHEEPVHAVTLTRGFYLGETPVTQGEFLEIMGYNPSTASLCGSCPNPCLDCPVETVTWHEAAAFANALSTLVELPECYTCTGSDTDVTCEAASPYTGGDIYDCPGYRLPTEAEWEAAARCGEDHRYAGSDFPQDVAWYGGINGGGTAGGDLHRVATKSPNACGLYDMSGNVYEWNQDHGRRSYGGPITDPVRVGGSNRLARGGAHNDVLATCRVSHRYFTAASDWSVDAVGLRLVRTDVDAP